MTDKPVALSSNQSDEAGVRALVDDALSVLYVHVSAQSSAKLDLAFYAVQGEIQRLRRADETFARQPSDCKHEHADIRCSDCGIDFRRVSHSDSFAPLLAAANEVLANFMPSFGGSREVDDCLVQLAAAVADAEKARPSEKATGEQS